MTKSKCEGCERRKKILYRAFWTVVLPIQRFIRTLSGSQMFLSHHKKMIHNIVLNGAHLEHLYATHEKYTAQWLSKHEQRITDLENEVRRLKQALEQK